MIVRVVAGSTMRSVLVKLPEEVSYLHQSLEGWQRGDKSSMDVRQLYVVGRRTVTASIQYHQRYPATRYPASGTKFQMFTQIVYNHL